MSDELLDGEPSLLVHRPEELADGARAVSFQGALFQEPAFADLVEHYLEHLQGVDKRDSSRRGEATALNAALDWMETHNIERPSTVEWRRYFDWRLSPECAWRVTPSTVDTYRATVHKVYRRCQENPKRGWMLISNPVTTSLLPPYYDQATSLPRAMGEPDVVYPAIYTAMPDPLAKALVETLYNQGVRIQEALGIPLPGGELEQRLRKRFLDLDARTLRIEFQRERSTAETSPLKTEYSKATVQLYKPTVEALRAALKWRREQDMLPRTNARKGTGRAARSFVFPYFKEQLEALMSTIREVAPEDFRPRERGEHGGDGWHVFRHSFATDLARSGVHPREIHRHLRHARQDTTDAYLRALLADVRGSDEVEEALAQRKARQAQAVSERSGKGLQLVKDSKS